MIEFPMNNTHWKDIEMEKKLPGFFEQLLGLVEPRYISKVEQIELEVHIQVDSSEEVNSFLIH